MLLKQPFADGNVKTIIGSMRTKSSDIADFYQQLALLVRSNLPLPESMRQLAQNFPAPAFKQILCQIGDRVSKGEKLSQVIQSYPQCFDPIHIRLISAGEDAGTLPETLFAVARYARFSRLISDRVRDIVAYPLLTIHLCALVILNLSINIMPKFEMMFQDLCSGSRLPILTRIVLGGGMFIHDHWILCVSIYLLLLGVTLWLFTPGVAAHRALLAIINFVPGSLKIVHSLDTARLCTLWSAFFRQRMPLHEAMESSSQLADLSAIRHALQRVTQKLRSGTNILEALSVERSIDTLIPLTFRSTPEGELPFAFAQLAELFEHRVTLSVRSASMMWVILSFAITTLVVATVVLAMFLPLISLIREMGA